MKRYLLFFGKEFYPKGGMGDFICDCNTVDECKIILSEKAKEDRYDTNDDDDTNYIFAHIYDLVEKKIIWEL